MKISEQNETEENNEEVENEVSMRVNIQILFFNFLAENSWSRWWHRRKWRIRRKKKTYKKKYKNKGWGGKEKHEISSTEKFPRILWNKRWQ